MSAQPSIILHEIESLIVSEYRERAELEKVRAQWSKLLGQTPGLSIFVTPEWMLSWWYAFGRNQECCVLVMTDPQVGVVGIIPLYWERQTLPLLPALRVLRLIGDGSGDSDDLDFIVKPGYAAAVVEAFFNWLSSKPWSVCEFNCLASKSEAVKLLMNKLQSLRLKSVASQRPLARIALPDTWAEYLRELSAKERHKIGIRLRRLESRHNVCFQRCERREELPDFLNSLYALHQKRWQAKGEPGTFSSETRRQFYEEMTRSLLNLGCLDLWQLELDGVPVAAQIGMRYGDCFCALQEGFDPDRAADSVGYVLRSHILKHCIASGVRNYDFLYGDQESKQRWGADIGHYIDLRFCRPLSYGALYISCDRRWRAAKNWLRARTSASVWKKLQRLRHGAQHPRP